MATTLPPPYYFDPTIYPYEQQPTYYDASAFYNQHQYQQQQQVQQQQHQQHQMQQNYHHHHHPIPPHPLPLDQTLEGEPDPILALNLRVLRRHLPLTSHILYQAQYAVIYTFSPQSTGWEKSGKEGTLFIVRETPPPPRPGGAAAVGSNSAALVVLNRRGMDNFVMRDWDAQVQSEGGHIILRGRVEGEAVAGGVGGGVESGGGGGGGGEGEDLTVWGVWIWEEEDLESTRGKREGVEACLVACAAGGSGAVEEEKEEEGESETAMDPDGDGAVFEERTQQLGGQMWDTLGQQQQQQQHQQWGYQHSEQVPQHFQHPYHEPPQPPPPHFQQPIYSQLQGPHQTPYQPPSVPPGPASPDLMALLNGGSGSQQSAFPPANVQSGSTDANGGREILGDLFRNAGR